MKAYLISLFGASLTIGLVELLAPASAQKLLKLLSALLFLCVLASPLPDLIGELGSLSENGSLISPPPPSDEITDQMNEALQSASKTYFVQSLTALLEREFSIQSGELRCAVLWEEQDDQLRPQRVTVILSGSAIWKDPDPIEKTVSSLLGCECVTAIE
ncbi:MAG: hypothetical protein E7620_04080 [Ruminococcaceae bacterium]|nr:hypothetical protein [Oscillospiraceae bacterium]